MNSEKKPKRTKERIAVFLVLAVIVVLFAFFFRDILIPFIKMELRHDTAGASELLRNKGLQGFFTVVLVEALQMVVVFIPAEFIQISSGLSYPFPVALLLCDLGVSLGATMIFVLVRIFRFRSPAFERRQQWIERLSKTVHERNTVTLLYLLFFMPIIPFGAICYYGSSTKLKYGKYIRTVATGVIPSIVVSNLMGAAGTAFLRNSMPLWLLFLIIVILAVLLFLLIYFFINSFLFSGTEGTPDSLTYALLFFVIRILRGRKMKVEIDDTLLRRQKRPYLMMVNHGSFYDFDYVSRMAHPKNPAFVVNDYYCSRPGLKKIAQEAGIIPKRLFTPDSATGLGMYKAIRKGYPVILFPEGRLSTDGRTNPVVEEGGAFYKRLPADIVFVKIEGAYFSGPKWRKKEYKSTIRAAVTEILRHEDIVKMSDEELNNKISEAIAYDASEHPVNCYKQKNKALGLENILYRCADCGSLYTTKGSGNELRCSACGKVHTLDETYHFTGDIPTIPAYYDRIREMEEREIPGLQLHTKVRTKIFPSEKGKTRKETGECFLTEEGFRYVSASEDFLVPILEMTALAYSCGKEFELYHKGELHYFYPLKPSPEPARWALLVDIMAKKRRVGERKTE